MPPLSGRLTAVRCHKYDSLSGGKRGCGVADRRLTIRILCMFQQGDLPFFKGVAMELFNRIFVAETAEGVLVSVAVEASRPITIGNNGLPVLEDTEFRGQSEWSAEHEFLLLSRCTKSGAKFGAELSARIREREDGMVEPPALDVDLVKRKVAALIARM